MLQCVFTGKAREAYTALSSEDCKDYNMVKAAVLKHIANVSGAGERPVNKHTWNFHILIAGAFRLV